MVYQCQGGFFLVSEIVVHPVVGLCFSRWCLNLFEQPLQHNKTEAGRKRRWLMLMCAAGPSGFLLPTAFILSGLVLGACTGTSLIVCARFNDKPLHASNYTGSATVSTPARSFLGAPQYYPHPSFLYSAVANRE